MNLQTFAVAALLLGSAAVLTVVATNPGAEADLAADSFAPGGAAPRPAVPVAGAAQGRLDMVVDNQGEATTVTISAEVGGRRVYDEVVDLPARQVWEDTLAVEPGPATVTMRLTPGGEASAGSDLRDCIQGHARWQAWVKVEAPLVASFGNESPTCVLGAVVPEDAPAEGGSFRGTGRITFAYTGPYGTCLPPQCEGMVAIGDDAVLGFFLDRPARMDVRAWWLATTPTAESMVVTLWRDMADGAGDMAGSGEGAREVRFALDAVPGEYTFFAHPDGPVGAAAAQDVNYEAVWTYR